MAAETPENRVIEIGHWLIDPAARLVSGPAGQRRLEPKPMALLVYLAGRPRQVVTREELLAAAWGDEMATDDVLSRAVSELRRALGDDSKTPVYVETIRGTGYRFVPAAAIDEKVSGAETSGSVPRRSLPITGIGVLVIAVAVLSLWLSRRSPAASPDPHLLPLTSEQGEAANPRLAPDGKRIAYAWSDGRHNDTRIRVRDLAGGNIIEPAIGVTRSMAWSPDGAELAVVGTDEAGVFVGIVPALGGPKRVVSRDVLMPVLGIDWSPDGHSLALASHQGGFATFRIEVMAVDSASAKSLTSGGGAAVGDAYPAFSPDGRSLAFARFATETSADIFIVDLASGAETRLTSDEHNVTALTFAVDGRSIVFASNRDGGSALWRVPLTGGTPVRIVNSDHGITGVTVSRATGITVLSAGDQQQQLWSFGTEANRVGAQVTQSLRTDGLPSIDPAGRRIAFVSDRSGAREIWSATLGGESATQLTHIGGFASAPEWSPDGRQLVSQRQGATETELWTIDPERRDARRLDVALLHPIAPTWSRDGLAVIVGAKTGGDWQLWRVPIDGRPPLQVSHHLGLRGVETVDGAGILFTKPSEPGLWRLDRATGAEAVLVPNVITGDWTNWAVAKDHVYFIDRDASGAQRISSFSFAERTTLVLVEHLQTPMGTGGLAVSPDERQVIVAQRTRREAGLYGIAAGK